MENPPSNLGTLKYVARPRYNINFSEKQEIMFKILEHPQNQYGKAGDIAVFKVVAQGEGLRYQWQYSKSNSYDWYDSGFEGANTDTQMVGIESFRNGDKYRCKITDKNGNTLISNQAKIIMTN